MGEVRATVALPSSYRIPSWVLAVVFSSYLVGNALVVTLFYPYWNIHKGTALLVMVVLQSAWMGLALHRGWSLSREGSRVVWACFLVALVTAAAAWGFTVLTSTEADYQRSYDGSIYIQMAQSLLDNHTFLQDGRPSQHFGPLYPLYLAPFYLVSRGLGATRAAILGMGVLALATVFFTTRRLYGSTRALVATTVVLSVPSIIIYTSRNLAEFLVLLLYTLTLYCLYRSLEEDHRRYVLFAGLFAGLAYLTKSSTGYFFLLAGVAGFLWRFRYVHWGILRDRRYWAAVVLFMVPVGLWGLRNIYVFWSPDQGLRGLLDSWNGDFYFNAAVRAVLPGYWERFAFLLLIFGAFTVPFLLSFLWPFLPQLRGTLARWREERVSLLLVGAVVPLVLGILISSIYYITEHYLVNPQLAGLPENQANYFIHNVVRYIVVALVPLLWLTFEVEGPKDARVEDPRANLVGDA